MVGQVQGPKIDGIITNKTEKQTYSKLLGDGYKKVFDQKGNVRENGLDIAKSILTKNGKIDTPAGEALLKDIRANSKQDIKTESIDKAAGEAKPSAKEEAIKAIQDLLKSDGVKPSELEVNVTMCSVKESVKSNEGFASVDENGNIIYGDSPDNQISNNESLEEVFSAIKNLQAELASEKPINLEGLTGKLDKGTFEGVSKTFANTYVYTKPDGKGAKTIISDVNIDGLVGDLIVDLTFKKEISENELSTIISNLNAAISNGEIDTLEGLSEAINATGFDSGSINFSGTGPDGNTFTTTTTIEDGSFDAGEIQIESDQK